LTVIPLPGKSLLTKWWFDGWHLPPGIFRCQQGYKLKTAVIFGEYLKVLKIFGKKIQKKTHLFGVKICFFPPVLLFIISYFMTLC
jgi:hypothetical protein